MSTIRRTQCFKNGSSGQSGARLACAWFAGEECRPVTNGFSALLGLLRLASQICPQILYFCRRPRLRLSSQRSSRVYGLPPDARDAWDHDKALTNWDVLGICQTLTAADRSCACVTLVDMECTLILAASCLQWHRERIISPF